MSAISNSSIAVQVAKQLLDIECVKLNVQNPFTWVSGIQSPVYCDNRKIPSFIEAREIVVDAFVEVIKKECPTVELISGVATGGIPLGILVADRMNLPFIYVRQQPKEHGLKKQVEGHFEKGQKVVLIEDLVSTGGSCFKAIQGIRNEGLDMLALISIMTYNFQKSVNLFEENNINYISLCDLDTVLDTAIDTDYITPAEKQNILAFRKNPQTWLHT